MDEHEWSNSHNPAWMLNWLAGGLHERKKRLFAHACCQRIMHLLPDNDCRNAVRSIARLADGRLPEDERAQVRSTIFPLVGAHRSLAFYSVASVVFALSRDEDPSPWAGIGAGAWCQGGSPTCQNYSSLAAIAASQARSYAAAELVWTKNDTGSLWALIKRAMFFRPCLQTNAQEYAIQCDLLRDTVGNPFRPALLPANCRSEDAIRIAEDIFNTGLYENLPVLGDALEDAGCVDTGILGHCRHDAMHVPGCFVVDLVLDRNSYGKGGAVTPADALR